MNENFVAFLWKTKLFKLEKLQTTTGKPIKIINTGWPNNVAGPDFFNAQIQIGDTLWAGNVEIHVKASDWLKHQHQHDKAYQNVILHVVHEADVAIKDQNNQAIPTLALKKYLLPNVYRNYLLLKSDTKWIPCEKLIPNLDHFTYLTSIDRLLVERLERKVKLLKQVLRSSKGDWEYTCLRMLAKAFGAKYNSQAFDMLMLSIPAKLLLKYQYNLLQLEAILFGQAGFLQQVSTTDAYANKLKEEYQYLSHKHNLQALQPDIWKFGGMRPPNFPSLRLAQFARLLNKNTALFHQLIEQRALPDLQKMLNVVIEEGYWYNHYRFEKESVQRRKSLGKAATHSIVINTIVPLLFLYGKETGEERHVDYALSLLSAIPPETNNIVKKWSELGIKAENAYQTQALLELKNEYCTLKKCLSCTIGNKLLRYSNSCP